MMKYRYIISILNSTPFCQVNRGGIRNFAHRFFFTNQPSLSPRLLRLLPDLNLEELRGLYPNRLPRTFKQWLPSHHLHELRHTFITRAQECGISRELVSLWAGHKADNTMTSNVYTHFSDEFQLQEIQKFDY